MVTTVGIVGLGLIGGSLARRVQGAGCRVLAWNHNPGPYRAARQAGITCLNSLEDLTRSRPQLIILCNSLVSMPEVLSRLGPLLDQHATTLADVGSVKATVRDQVRDAGMDACYIGAHPMAGNERSGFAASDAALFDGALWALTVDRESQYARFLQVARFITEQVGNRLIVLDDATHDRAAAMISHMPHAVSTAMINLLSTSEERNIAGALAAGSWRDMTRVALTDPKRTRAMIEEDRVNVEGFVRDMAERLTDFADALHDDDADRIEAFFTQGEPFRDYRRRMAQPSQPSQLDGQQNRPEQETQRLLLHRDQWRDELLRSARRGEQIIRFARDTECTVVTHAIA